MPVQFLDFEVQMRIVVSDIRSDQQLRIEGCRRHLGKLWRRRPTVCERSKKSDVESMRQAEYIGDEAVVVVHRHLDLLGHRRRKQRSCRRSRLGVAGIAKNDVAAGQQAGLRPEHRMDRCHAATRAAQFPEAVLQRRLQ